MITALFLELNSSIKQYEPTPINEPCEPTCVNEPYKSKYAKASEKIYKWNFWCLVLHFYEENPFLRI